MKKYRAIPPQPDFFMRDGVEYPPALIMFFEFAVRRAATRQRLHAACPRAHCHRRKACQLRLDFLTGEAEGGCAVTEATIERAVDYVDFFRTLLRAELFHRAYKRAQRPLPPPEQHLAVLHDAVWQNRGTDDYFAKLRAEDRAEREAERAIEIAEEEALRHQRQEPGAGTA